MQRHTRRANHAQQKAVPYGYTAICAMEARMGQRADDKAKRMRNGNGNGAEGKTWRSLALDLIEYSGKRRGKWSKGLVEQACAQHKELIARQMGRSVDHPDHPNLCTNRTKEMEQRADHSDIN